MPVKGFETICKVVFMALGCFSLALSAVSVYLATVDYNNHYYKRAATLMWGDNAPVKTASVPHYTGPYPYTLEYHMFYSAVVITAFAGLALLLGYWRVRSEIWFVVAFLFNVPFNYFVFLGNNFYNYSVERAHLAIIMFAFVVLASYAILRKSVDMLRKPTVKQWSGRPSMQGVAIVLKVLMLAYLTHNLVNFGWLSFFISPVDLFLNVLPS